MGKQSREKREKRERGEVKLERERLDIRSVMILRNIILIGTFLILFTPFIISGKYFFPFVGPKSIYFMALVEIIFVAWLILIISNPKYRPRFNILLLALILFLTVQILSSIFGVDFSRSFWSKYERMTGLVMQFHLFIFFLVASSVFKKKEDWLKIFGVSVFAAILMSFISLSPKIGINMLGQMAAATRGGATLGNSSFLGTYLLFNFFFVLYLFFNSKGGFKIFSAFGLIIIGIALIYSTARAALLATLGGLVLLLLLWLIFCHKGKIRVIGITISTLLLIGVIVSVFFIIKPDIIKPDNFLHKIIVEKIIGTVLGGRLQVWGGGWKGFLAKPLLGWGPENFEIVFTKYFNPCMGGPDCGGDVWYDRAHNIIFDTLATTGILGLISYLGIFAVVFYALWKKFFKQGIGFWTTGIFSIVLISYFIQNLTVFDMVSSYMLFFLVLGFIGSIAANGTGREDVNEKEKPINFLAVAIILILFIFPFLKFVIQPVQADRSIITSLGFAVGSKERLDSFKRTIEISPVGRYQIIDFFTQNTLENVQGEKLSEVQTENTKNEFDFLVQELENSIKKSPLDFRLYLKLGQLYNTYAVLFDTTKLSKSEEVLGKAIEVSPTNQQGYWSLAQTKLYEGQAEEALSLAEKALSLEPKSRQSNLIVIQIAKIMGNFDLAKKKAEEAIKINPSLEPDIKNILEQ